MTKTLTDNEGYIILALGLLLGAFLCCMLMSNTPANDYANVLCELNGYSRGNFVWVNSIGRIECSGVVLPFIVNAPNPPIEVGVKRSLNEK